MIRLAPSTRLIVPALAAACLLAVAPHTARAQTATAASPAAAVAAKREAMQRLAYMVGQWQGEGWIQMGGPRITFRGGERVQSRLGGITLLVEGDFSSRPPGAEHDVPVHQTIGVIGFDETDSTYRLTTWTATGATGNHTLELRDDGWRWQLDVGTGTVRYTATFPSNDEWVEIGEFSREWEGVGAVLRDETPAGGRGGGSVMGIRQGRRPRFNEAAAYRPRKRGGVLSGLPGGVTARARVRRGAAGCVSALLSAGARESVRGRVREEHISGIAADLD